MVIKNSALILMIIFFFIRVNCQGEIPDYPVMPLEALEGIDYIIFLQSANGEYMVVIIEEEYFLVYLE